jgi:hypothetical protein
VLQELRQSSSERCSRFQFRAQAGIRLLSAPQVCPIYEVETPGEAETVELLLPLGETKFRKGWNATLLHSLDRPLRGPPILIRFDLALSDEAAREF